MRAGPSAAAVPGPGRDPTEWLRSLLDLPRLMSLGWDPNTGVWTVDPAQGAFSYQACAVAGCDYAAAGEHGLCGGCRSRWRGGPPSLEEFVARPRTRERSRTERLCAVCCVPGHMRPANVHGICVACEALRRRRGQSVEALVAGEDRFAPARPRPTIGHCRAATCGRLAAYAIGLCHGHYTRWTKAGRPPLAGWCDAVGPLLGDRGTRVSLAGVEEHFMVELLFGVQSALDRGRRLRPAELRTVAERARRQRCRSLAELRRDTTNTECVRFVTQTLDAIELAAKTPEGEATNDVWDLRVWGFAGTLSFIGGQPNRHPGRLPAEAIRQRWLRDGAKAWAASRLPLLRSASGAHSVVATLGRWSGHLARRADGGEDPVALTKEDISSFLVSLRVAANAGRLPPNMHSRTLWFLRQFLRESRDLGLDERAGPLFGLARSVIVAREEIPAPPRRDSEDEAGDAIPDAVLAQLLDEASLARLSPDGRRRLEIGLEVGRRPSELCRLRLDCVAYDERLNEATGATEAKAVLVYDMTKVNTLRCRLPIHERTAGLIADQQAAVRARFPDTPGSELVLFPAIQRPKGGRRPVSASSWASELRGWAERLELFEGRLDPEGGLHVLGGPDAPPVRFDSSRVFPYALRHTYAQRHVNAGTPVEVLKELMGHDKLDTTAGYYRISSRRKRDAIRRVLPLQVTVTGARLRLVGDAADSDLGAYALSQVAVPMGSCTEPSNVRARGGACDFRYRCFGCRHFRTDPSYVPELRAYLTRLLTARERLAAAVPELAEWARREASPSDDEIAAVRNLIAACEDALALLEPDDRAATEAAIEVLRTTRDSMDTTFPVAFRGSVAQPAPVLFPNVAADGGHQR
ncbi:MAG: tyrosine-type recombinase/integrase [Acidimicrobiales bacterium]